MRGIAAVKFDQALADRQPGPSPPNCRLIEFRLLESVEDARQGVGLDAVPLSFTSTTTLSIAAATDADTPVMRGELDHVLQQVQKTC